MLRIRIERNSNCFKLADFLKSQEHLVIIKNDKVQQLIMLKVMKLMHETHTHTHTHTYIHTYNHTYIHTYIPLQQYQFLFFTFSVSWCQWWDSNPQSQDCQLNISPLCYNHRHLRIQTAKWHVPPPLFASLVLLMAAATKKEKKRRSLPLEGWHQQRAHNKP